jgi:hypothetical protein
MHAVNDLEIAKAAHRAMVRGRLVKLFARLAVENDPQRRQALIVKTVSLLNIKEPR